MCDPCKRARWKLSAHHGFNSGASINLTHAAKLPFSVTSHTTGKASQQLLGFPCHPQSLWMAHAALSPCHNLTMVLPLVEKTNCCWARLQAGCSSRHRSSIALATRQITSSSKVQLATTESNSSSLYGAPEPVAFPCPPL